MATYNEIMKQIEQERQKAYKSLKASDIQEYYRQKTNELTNLRGIKKKAIASHIGINVNSLYQWLRGDFNLIEERIDKLKDLIKIIEI